MEGIFNSSNETDDDDTDDGTKTPMPALDGSSDSDSLTEGKEDEPTRGDYLLQGYDESERTWEPLAQVYEDVPVITQKYVDEVDDPTLAEALDQVIEDDLPDLVEVSSSESSDEDSSDED